MENCCENYKNSPRSEQTVKALTTRINRISGQLNGVKNMLEDNRFCGDILIQLSAALNAVRSLGYAIIEEHIATCVAEKYRAGEDEGVSQEVVEMLKRME